MMTSPGLAGLAGPSKLPSACVDAMYLSLLNRLNRKNAGVNCCVRAIAAARADPLEVACIPGARRSGQTGAQDGHPSVRRDIRLEARAIDGAADGGPGLSTRSRG